MPRLRLTRFRAVWAEVHNSLWFLPSLMTASAAVLAGLTVAFDRRLFSDWEIGSLPWFLFSAGAEGARGVLSTIAGSIITVTGVVFSITIVALQLASGQLTPRVLRAYTEDRGNQVVLGVFIGTFTYALLVLRTVRSEADDFERFVPAVSVTVAMLLALLSIGFLIYFVSHIARTIQAEFIIERVTRDALHSVERLFPEEFGEPARREPETALPEGPPQDVVTDEGGYLQSIDEEGILDITEEHDLVLRMEKEVGDFVVPGETLASVWPKDRGTRAAGDILESFRLGPERTQYQDIERGLIELTDIAIRALSPSLNDPTTAIVCIDRLSHVLVALGRRRLPDRARRARDGTVRVVARRPEYEQFVELTFEQLRHHGSGDPAVALRLIQALHRVAQRIPAERRRPLAGHVRHIRDDALRRIESEADRARLSEAAEVALRAADA